MANSGQSGSFFGENVGDVDSPSHMNPGTDSYPADTFDPSEYLNLDSPLNPTMETELNGDQRGQPAGTSHPISFWGQPSSDQNNMNGQTTGTLDSQQHGQPAGTNHQISFSGQPNSGQTNSNVQTTHIPKTMTEEQRERRRETCRKSRAKKKNKEIEMQDKLKELEDETGKKKIEIADLKDEVDSMRENLQSQTNEKDKLKSDLEKLKQERDEQNALLQELLKDKDLKFIKEGVKHDMKPTQDQSPSGEERHSEKEISSGNLDGGDSEDDNDYKKKKKRAARPASSEGRSVKVSKSACYDAIADQRNGSKSNYTAIVREPYSITECLRILNTMGDIPYRIVKKATVKFESPVVRETFVALREDWRRDWVKDLEDDA